MQINIADLIAAIKSSEYGTGTLSTRLKIHPNILQKIIATGECENDLFEKMGKVLGRELTEVVTITGNDEDAMIETISVPADVTADNPLEFPQVVEEELPAVLEELFPVQPVDAIADNPEVEDEEEDMRDWLSGTNTEEIELTRVSEIAIANSVNKLKLLVSDGKVNPQHLLQAERERIYPRVSLTNWLLKLIGTE